MVFDETGHNLDSKLNHASTSFTPAPEQVGTSHAAELEEIGVTGCYENVCPGTSQSNHFREMLETADEPPSMLVLDGSPKNHQHSCPISIRNPHSIIKIRKGPLSSHRALYSVSRFARPTRSFGLHTGNSLDSR